MGEREPVVTEIGHGPSAAPSQPPAPQAQALVDQAQALAKQVQAFTKQAQAFADHAQDPVNEVQVPADQAHALADRAHALANQAQALLTYINNVDQAEKSVFAYQEIAILQEINLHYPFHKLALEDWERREEYLRNSVSRREGQSVELTNQISNIFSVFVVFLGLLLTTVSLTANTELGGAPVCGKIWFPIMLTGLGTAVTVVGIWDKFKSLQSLELTIHKEKRAQIEVAERAQSLRREGPKKFKFFMHAKSKPATNPKLRKKWFVLFVSIMIFTLIFIMSYFVILCNTWVVGWRSP